MQINMRDLGFNPNSTNNSLWPKASQLAFPYFLKAEKKRFSVS